MRNKKIWIFNATNDIVGNPKWLFMYVNKYRKDIDAYWMCDNIHVVNYVRSLGFNDELYHSKKSEKIKSVAGVFVVHQVKEHIPVKFKNEVVILNLWHGVGIKPIECLLIHQQLDIVRIKNILNIMKCTTITNYFWPLHHSWKTILLRCLIWTKIKSSEQVIQQICLIKTSLVLLIIILNNIKA